jgi:protein TonB
VPVPVAAAPAQKAPSGPVEVNDLGARLVSFSPPSYPLQSRRDMEEGTVTLALLVGLDGNVLDISVSGTSGFPRLDKAALEAVRKWRWSPMMRSGEAVMLRGSLKIPFTLKR